MIKSHLYSNLTSAWRQVGQGDLAIFVMGGSGRVEIMVKINYSDTAGQYKEGKSGESVKYGSE